MSVTVLIIITVLLWGSVPIIDKIALTKTDPLVGVIIRSWAVFLPTIVLMVFTGRTKAVFTTEPKTILLFAITGILAGFLAMLTYYGALKLAPTSKIVALGSTYPLVSAALAIILLREQVSLGRLMGVGLIIVGVWLVK